MPEFPVYLGDFIKDKLERLAADGLDVSQARWQRHAAFLFGLYAELRANEPIPPHQTPPQRQAMLTNQFAVRHRRMVTQHPRAAFGIITQHQIPVGRITVDRNAERIMVLELSLMPAQAHAGIEQTILSLLSAEAAYRGIPLVDAGSNPLSLP